MYGDFVPTAATGVSDDGTVIVGSGYYVQECDHVPTDLCRGSEYLAFRWTLQEGFQTIGMFPEGESAGVRAVSGDGSTIVGYCRAIPPGADWTRAFRWTATDGMKDISTGGTNSLALAVNSDGLIVVGTDAGAAFLWTASTGTIYLSTFLANRGVAIGSRVLQEATGISANGRVIVGNGKPDYWSNIVRAYRIEMPGPGDLDGDGDCDLRDLSLFARCFDDDVISSVGCGPANMVANNTAIDLVDWAYLATFVRGPE